MASAYERYSALAEAVGCRPPAEGEWSVPQACDAPALDWIECVEQDTSQCICESDGTPNCEGSFKADEGPALCVDEIETLNACME